MVTMIGLPFAMQPDQYLLQLPATKQYVVDNTVTGARNDGRHLTSAALSERTVAYCTYPRDACIIAPMQGRQSRQCNDTSN